MPKQNIYDNEVFFSGYKGIRDQEVNANVLFEIHHFFDEYSCAVKPQFRKIGNR